VPLVGLNLSLLQSLAEWDPFTLLLERDSGRAIRADVSFLSKQPLVPVVGSVLVHPQREYGARALHAHAHDALHQLLARRDMAVVEIDTRLDENATGLATPAQVESLIARMNAIVTTRLHGMVLALKNGVPALVVDPVAGGAKIARQARALEWPAVFVADALDPNDLARSLDWCLTADACDQARNAAERARIEVRQVREQFVSALRR
jgi:polysaccharide pyruvyl transferase WcaK-like protein